MLDVTSTFLSHGDAEFLGQYSHSFLPPPGRFSSSERRYLGFAKSESTIDTGCDQQSTVTNMSNVTTASCEASGLSAERDVSGTGGGCTVQPPISSAAMCGGMNSKGLAVVVKRKRSLPGTPDPEAEVISLSPRTLLATNRFLCEICGKGFQRDQNLQLHRRGHNLPWKLKQRSSKDVRKRVYICPEASCVHHEPARALGDLTGIKKHFCRKHGEKKWKCERCSKRYAVQSDWKAHSKICGTREYRCDCGTLFSRRDSFITHRAFCDALSGESARVSTGGHLSSTAGMMMAGLPGSSTTMMGSLSSVSRNGLHLRSGAGLNLENSSLMLSSSRPSLSLWRGTGPHSKEQSMIEDDNFPVDPFGSSMDSFEGPKPAVTAASQYADLLRHGSEMAGLAALAEFRSPARSCWEPAASTSGLSGLPPVSSLLSQAHASSSAQASATALLQKAAQIGATTSNPALLQGFGNTSLRPVQSSASTSTWPPNYSASFGGSYQGFLPSMTMHNQNVLQSKSSELDELRASTLFAFRGSGDEGVKNRSSFIDAGRSDMNIQEMLSSMAHLPSASVSGSSNSQFYSCTSNLFGAANSENRSLNSLMCATDNLFNASNCGQQQQTNPPLIGFDSNAGFKSLDGVTRDFFGIKGVDALISGATERSSSINSLGKSSSIYRLGMASPTSMDSLRPLSSMNARQGPNRSLG